MKRIAVLIVLVSFLMIGQALAFPPTPPGGDMFKNVYDADGNTVIGTSTKSFIINEPTATDDFLIWRTPVAITIIAIHGVLLTGTNVIGGIDECDSNGANCVAVDSDITFNGSLDSDDGSLTNATIDAGDWIRWHTTSVDAPGYLTVTIYFQ